MEFEIEKCAMLIMEKGKGNGKRIEMTNQENMRTLGGKRQLQKPWE